MNIDVGILRETNIRAIKKCLFFLTHFSRNFQDAVALRLVKRVFEPNEELGLDPNSNNLYIINQGRAELQYTRFHHNNPICKTIKIINKDGNRANEKLGVTSNLFGFVSVILRRKVNLTALSK